MSYRSAYTLAEAREYLALYKEAQRALVTGQAKEYKIGSRSVTFIDLDELEAQITKFANIVDAYENDKRTSRSVAVVFRDT